MSKNMYKSGAILLLLVVIAWLTTQVGVNFVQASEIEDKVADFSGTLLPSKVELTDSSYDISNQEKTMAINELRLITDKGSIDFQSKKEQKVTLQDSTVLRTAVYNVIGNGIDSNSYYSFSYDISGNLVHSQSLIAITDDKKNTEAFTVNNGELTNKVIVDGKTRKETLYEYSNQGWKIAIEARGGGKDWVACFSKCLGNSGLASWVVTLILAACGTACVATAGAACIACAVGVAATSGATAGSCVAKCG